jgi:hypothetical protein
MRTVWLVTHQDLRRAAKIRVVSNAISEAFERGARVLRFGRVRRASRIDTERSAEKPVIYASAPPADGYVEKQRKVKRGFKKQVASEGLSE